MDLYQQGQMGLHQHHAGNGLSKKYVCFLKHLGVLQPILKIYLAHKTMENMITALVGQLTINAIYSLL